MNKITSLMTSLHEGHKAEERLMCIDNMLFKKCEDTKYTILQAFWWYRKHSIPLDKVKQAREEMKECSYSLRCFNEDVFDEDERVIDLDNVLIILDKLIENEEAADDKEAD